MSQYEFDSIYGLIKAVDSQTPISNVKKYDSQEYCIKSLNYVQNIYESKNKFIACEQFTEFNLNELNESRLVISHSIFDCDDSRKWTKYSNLNQTNNNYIDIDLSVIQIINLSPTVKQIQIILTAFLKYFSYENYAIVYKDTSSNEKQNFTEDIFYYKRFAGHLIYRLSSLFNLDFSLPLYHPDIDNSINKTKSNFLK